MNQGMTEHRNISPGTHGLDHTTSSSACYLVLCWIILTNRMWCRSELYIKTGTILQNWKSINCACTVYIYIYIVISRTTTHTKWCMTIYHVDSANVLIVITRMPNKLCTEITISVASVNYTLNDKLPANHLCRSLRNYFFGYACCAVRLMYTVNIWKYNYLPFITYILDVLRIRSWRCCLRWRVMSTIYALGAKYFSVRLWLKLYAFPSSRAQSKIEYIPASARAWFKFKRGFKINTC